jgi:hypothetical protein
MTTNDAIPLHKTLCLPGAVTEEYRRCGKPNCHCADGPGHGPYYYRRWRKDGRQRWEYIKRAEVGAVRAACEAYRQHWRVFGVCKDASCRVSADLNRLIREFERLMR